MSYLSIPFLRLESRYICICRYVVMSHSVNITFVFCPIFSCSWSSKLQKFINCNFLSFYTIDDSYCLLDHDCVVKYVGGHVDRNMLPPCSGNGGGMFLSTWVWVLVTGSHVFIMQHITVRLVTVLTFLCCHNIFVVG